PRLAAGGPPRLPPAAAGAGGAARRRAGLRGRGGGPRRGGRPCRTLARLRRLVGRGLEPRGVGRSPPCGRRVPHLPRPAARSLVRGGRAGLAPPIAWTRSKQNQTSLSRVSS